MPDEELEDAAPAAAGAAATDTEREDAAPAAAGAATVSFAFAFAFLFALALSAAFRTFAFALLFLALFKALRIEAFGGSKFEKPLKSQPRRLDWHGTTRGERKSTQA